MRSPLSWLGGQLLVDHRRRKAGLPHDPSRRSALKGLAAGPLVGALACSGAAADPTTAVRPEKVVVLGAGLAGLNCCRHLVREGFTVSVVEALDRPGGRVYSVPGLFLSAPDRVAELGGEWINSADTDLLDLVKELGLTLIDLYASAYDELVWLRGERMLPRDLFRDLEPLVTAIDEALGTFSTDLISYANPGGAEAVDHTSVADWMGPTTDGTVAGEFLRLLITTDYGLEIEDQSALNLLFSLGSGVSEYDERYRILGGNQQVADALATRFADRIRFGTAAVAIREADDGRLRVEYADGSDELADYVVSSLPFTVLRKLTLDLALSDVKLRAINELGYGTNAKLLLPFAGRPWEATGENGLLLSDTGLQSGWDTWDQQAGPEGGFANFTGGARGEALAEGTPEARGNELIDELEPIWPGTRAAWTGEAARQSWPTEPTALGSYSCYRIGQWTTIGGAEAESAGRLHFCGEHTSAEFQGYMNGAAESGRRAAEEIVDRANGAERRAKTPRACMRRPWVRPR